MSMEFYRGAGCPFVGFVENLVGTSSLRFFACNILTCLSAFWLVFMCFFRVFFYHVVMMQGLYIIGSCRLLNRPILLIAILVTYMHVVPPLGMCLTAQIPLSYVCTWLLVR